MQLTFDFPPTQIKAQPAQPRGPIRRAAGQAVQLMLDFFGAVLSPDEIDDEPVIKRVVKASEAPPIQTSGPCSVFALAGLVLASGAKPKRQEEFSPPPLPLCKIERSTDGVRVIRLRHDETDEWAEKERLRRARQKPPKPTAKAKTRSEKLTQLIGETT